MEMNLKRQPIDSPIEPAAPEEEPKAKHLKPKLPEHAEIRAKELAEAGKVEEMFIVLKENGLSASSQAELASNFTKELEESIRLISWTKKRLMYMTAILEFTLNGENKKITAVENLIRNYLIFTRVFKENENKMPRFGQFSYVMRTIFNNVTSKEEIFTRIADHKTFGEITLDRDEVSSLVNEIEKISDKIKEGFIRAEEKKRQLEGFLEEAEKEEKHEKGVVWSSSYSEPKDYVFPNYTFQTGPLKGQNRAKGRSSWEPMLLAYADVVNKKIEDRIIARESMSEEEKETKIKESRVELLYEPFEFVVDIKTGDKGGERPVIYILDFIDINRWRAVEVKGPLTPKAAEKIRLFKKYYVDGDYSDLPEEKKIIMMSYVQNKKLEIAAWCEKNGYPAFDHFSSMTVLGAYKWDQDLNNFNKYAGVSEMPGLSEKQKENMQKGFIRTLEDRIETGKTPDIRPEGYIKSEDLPKIIKINGKQAKAKNIPYEVEKPVSTNFFDAPTITDYISDKGLKQGEELIWKKTLETLPIPENNIEVIFAIRSFKDFFKNLLGLLHEKIKSLKPEEQKRFISGKAKILVTLGNFFDDLALVINNIKKFREYLMSLEKNNTDIKNSKFPANLLTKKLKNLMELLDHNFIKEKNQLLIDNNFFSDVKPSLLFEWSDVADSYISQILGKYFFIFEKRINEIDPPMNDALLSDPQATANINKYLHWVEINGYEAEDLEELKNHIILMAFLDEHVKITGQNSMIYRISCEYTRDSSYNPKVMGSLAYSIKNKFRSLEEAARFFSQKNDNKISENDYLAFLKTLYLYVTDPSIFERGSRDFKEDSGFSQRYLLSKKELINSVAEILLKNEFGQENFVKLNERVKKYFEKYLKIK